MGTKPMACVVVSGSHRNEHDPRWIEGITYMLNISVCQVCTQLRHNDIDTQSREILMTKTMYSMRRGGYSQTEHWRTTNAHSTP